MLHKTSHPKLVVDCAPGNVVDLTGVASAKGTIKVATTAAGTGNTVRFGKGATFSGSISVQGKNNLVEIGQNCVIRGSILVKGNDQRVVIGDQTTFVDVYILCQEGCNVDIGRWCMFSRDIEIRTTDAHSVVDRVSRKRLNLPKSIVIGDHVWIGVGVLVSKGSGIPSDSIVGAKTFVNTLFEEEGTVIAGSPARVVKRGITWNRLRRLSFTQDELDQWRAPNANMSDSELADEIVSDMR